MINGQIWVPPPDEVAKLIEAPKLVPTLELAAVVGEGGKEVEGVSGAVVVAVVGAAVVAAENKAYSVRVTTYTHIHIHRPRIHIYTRVRVHTNTLTGSSGEWLCGLYLCETVCFRIVEEHI